MTLLESLKQYTTVVADTGDIEAIAPQSPARRHDESIASLPRRAKAGLPAPGRPGLRTRPEAWRRPGEMAAEFIDRLFVLFGCEILKVVPGRVSTEVPASLSFDTEGAIVKARKLISLYEAEGVSRERILIKVASTWEGIRAAERLEKEGIHCNLTLLFSFAQAVACAEAASDLDFALCRTYLRLVQEGRRRQGDSPRPGSRGRVRNPHL